MDHVVITDARERERESKEFIYNTIYIYIYIYTYIYIYICIQRERESKEFLYNTMIPLRAGVPEVRRGHAAVCIGEIICTNYMLNYHIFW